MLQYMFSVYSEAHNTVSWLDHVVATQSLLDSFISVHVDPSFITSDHFPLIVSINVAVAKIECDVNVMGSQKVRWDKLSEKDRITYKSLTDANISNVVLNHSLLLCDDTNCKKHEHISSIDLLYNDIKGVMIDSAQQFIKERASNKHDQVPGWKDYCSVSHAEARAAFLHWVSCGKPRIGTVFEEMKRTRAYFKFTLRKCRVDQDRINSDRLARNLLSKDNVCFWKEVNKLKGSTCHTLAFTVENVSGHSNICSMWKNHYETLLNSSSSTSVKKEVMNRTKVCGNFTTVQPIDVYKCVNQLGNGKSCGVDNLQAEHFK